MKNLKKMINAAFLIAFIALSTTSCNKKENSTSNGNKLNSTSVVATKADSSDIQISREKPINGKLKAVVELGAEGFNYFVVNIDSDKNWAIEKREFGVSIIKGMLATKGDIKTGLKEFIKQILNYGVESKNIHFVISSGAMKDKEVLQPIINELEERGYFVNSITADQEATYVYYCVMPNEYKSKAFTVDIGSGNTKVAYLENSNVETLETYGAKYYKDNVSATVVLNEVKSIMSDIPKSQTETCFIIGGVPFEMAKSLRKNNERFTNLKLKLSDYNDLIKQKGQKVQSGLNIFNGITEGTSCKQFVFDWDANFSIGFLLGLPY